MTQGEYLTKPDGNVIGFLQDPRVWSAAVGVVTSQVLEKWAFTNFRDTFGVSREVDGTIIFVPKEQANTPVTGTANKPQFSTNRQLSRAASVIAAVAAIEFTKGKSPSFTVPFQYAMLGVAVAGLSRIFYDLVPSLVIPAKK